MASQFAVDTRIAQFPSHPSWLWLLRCNQPGSGHRHFCCVHSWLTQSSSHGLLTILGTPLPHTALLGLMAEIIELLLGPWGQVHAMNTSPFCSGSWSILLIPRSNRPTSPSCPPHDPNLIWRSHCSWRSGIIHVVSCCVIHDEWLNWYDEWGRVS